MSKLKFSSVGVAAFALAAFCFSLPLRAASINVTTDVDEYDSVTPNSTCSLREAIHAANVNRAIGGCPAGEGGTVIDHIYLQAGHTYPLTRSDTVAGISSSDLDIYSSLTISVEGDQWTGTPTVINGGGIGRIFYIYPRANVTLSLLTLTNGDATRTTVSTNKIGGGIRNEGNLTLDQVVVTGNKADQGGGIYTLNTGLLTVKDSAVVSNTAVSEGAIGGMGGGISVSGLPSSSLAVQITNSTIGENHADRDGGGFYIGGGNAILNHVTVANNVADNNRDGTGNGGGLAWTAPGRGTITLTGSRIAGNTIAGLVSRSSDCSVTINSGGYNFIGSTADCTVTGGSGDKLNSSLPSPLSLVPVSSDTSTGSPTPFYPIRDANDPALNGGEAWDKSDATRNGCPLKDQRTIFDRKDGKCDIGSYEVICGDGREEGNEACDDTGPSRLCNSDCTIRQPVCGDGYVLPGEACDDGNKNNNDDCLNTCALATCGDGFVRAGVEVCDEGSLNGKPNHCNSLCAGITPATCGNGAVEAGETCDEGGNNGQPGRCNTTCNGTVAAMQDNQAIIPDGTTAQGTAVGNGTSAAMPPAGSASPAPVAGCSLIVR